MLHHLPPLQALPEARKGGPGCMGSVDGGQIPVAVALKGRRLFSPQQGSTGCNPPPP